MKKFIEIFIIVFAYIYCNFWVLVALIVYPFAIYYYKFTNASKFIEKVEMYKKYHHIKTPIPEHYRFSFNKVQFPITNEFVQYLKTNIKKATIDDIKNNPEGLIISTLISLTPDDLIVCNITDNLKIKKCKKETAFGNTTSLTIQQMKEVLDLPNDFFE